MNFDSLKEERATTSDKREKVNGQQLQSERRGISVTTLRPGNNGSVAGGKRKSSGLKTFLIWPNKRGEMPKPREMVAELLLIAQKITT